MLSEWNIRFKAWTGPNLFWLVFADPGQRHSYKPWHCSNWAGYNIWGNSVRKTGSLLYSIWWGYLLITIINNYIILWLIYNHLPVFFFIMTNNSKHHNANSPNCFLYFFIIIFLVKLDVKSKSVFVVHQILCTYNILPVWLFYKRVELSVFMQLEESEYQIQKTSLCDNLPGK